MRPMMINGDLARKIKELLERNPSYRQEQIIDDLTSNPNALRIPKEAIKSGVKEYLRIKPLENGGIKNGSSHTAPYSIDLEAGQPKKKVKKNQFIIEFEDRPAYSFDRLGGIQDIRREIDFQLFNIVSKKEAFKAITTIPQNKGFLISGAAGSGKTLLANCILSRLQNIHSYSAYSVTALDLLSSDSEERIRKIFETAEENIPAAVLIDDIDELCNKQNNKRMQASPVVKLCAYLRRIHEKSSDIIVIATSSSVEKLDSLTKPDYFHKTIKITNPTEPQRTEILDQVLSAYSHELPEGSTALLAKTTAGFVAVDLVSYVKEATKCCVNRGKSSLSFQDFTNSFLAVTPVLKRQGFAKIPTTKLSDVGALDDVKQSLIQEIIMPMKDQQKFKSMNFQVGGGGILLHGPPGCGKTMLAKAIANEANANFITVKGPQLLTKYVGESEEAVRKVFEKAKMSAPCIIFFDQFDALAPKRQDSGNQVTERVVNTLLNELNGVDDRQMVFVIAATNRPDMIDEAVLRSGRIQKHIRVPLPNELGRLSILQTITRRIEKQNDLNLQVIAKESLDFSGADLNFLVKKAVMRAISENKSKVCQQDLRYAIDTFQRDKYSKRDLFGQEKQDTGENLLTRSRDSTITENIENSRQTLPRSNIFEEFLRYISERHRRPQ